MNTTDQRICLWLVPGFGALLMLAFGIFPGFFPPLSPTLSAEEVATFYRNNVGAIRASMLICNVCGVAFIRQSNRLVSRLPKSISFPAISLPRRAIASKSATGGARSPGFRAAVRLRRTPGRTRRP